MAWFRFYDEVVDDPKVQRLPLILFRAWVNFMCLAKRNNGILPEIQDIAYGLRVTKTRAEWFFRSLLSAGLIDKIETSFQMHNWHGRQFQSDVSTERVKRFRKRKGNATETVNETFQAVSPPLKEKESTKEKENTTPLSDTETEQKQNRPPKSPAPSALERGFEDFWQAYPLKRGRIAALRAWNRLAPKNGLREIIIGAVALQSKSQAWLKENGRFIPHPATWLNQGRWDDEIIVDDRAAKVQEGLKILYGK